MRQYLMRLLPNVLTKNIDTLSVYFHIYSSYCYYENHRIVEWVEFGCLCPTHCRVDFKKDVILLHSILVSCKQLWDKPRTTYSAMRSVEHFIEKSSKSFSANRRGLNDEACWSLLSFGRWHQIHHELHSKSWRLV